MRSGSSLLTKLLGTSPEVVEHGELHINYSGRVDLLAMQGRLLKSKGQLVARPPQRITLDKLLRNYQLSTNNLGLIERSGTKLIFLCRLPEASVSSQLRTFETATVDGSIEYYCSRLQHLEQVARTLRGRVPMVAIDYEDILLRTADVFSLLEEYLELQTHLSANYSANHDAESHRGRGDPSVNLARGEIVARKPVSRGSPDISEAKMAPARLVYESCRDTLRASCSTIVEDSA